MSEKPVNKFNKAQEDRRKSFIVENDYVADDVVSTAPPQSKPVLSSGGLKSIIEQEKEVKVKTSITIDADTDEFYMRLGRILGLSKSSLVSEILSFSINTNSDIQELAKTNKKVKKILDDFNKGFY